MKEAKLFSILVDEVENHKVEQFSICINQWTKTKTFESNFWSLVDEQLNGKVIATEIIRVLEKSNLDINNCRAQEYDGTSNM